MNLMKCWIKVYSLYSLLGVMCQIMEKILKFFQVHGNRWSKYWRWCLNDFCYINLNFRFQRTDIRRLSVSTTSHTGKVNVQLFKQQQIIEILIWYWADIAWLMRWGESKHMYTFSFWKLVFNERPTIIFDCNDSDMVLMYFLKWQTNESAVSHASSG